MRQQAIFSTRVLQGLACGLLLCVAGCASGPLSTREKGALAGGGIGAASGAIIGSTVGAPGAGAAIGGALGAVGGGVVGDQLQSRERDQAYQQSQIEQNQREIRRQERELDELQRRDYQ